MIAGQALRRGLTVITADATDFGRVDDLMWEDWSR
jgi:tRNA(fMet)-specific endonuclease VapC